MTNQNQQLETLLSTLKTITSTVISELHEVGVIHQKVDTIGVSGYKVSQDLIKLEENLEKQTETVNHINHVNNENNLRALELKAKLEEIQSSLNQSKIDVDTLNRLLNELKVLLTENQDKIMNKLKENGETVDQSHKLLVDKLNVLSDIVQKLDYRLELEKTENQVKELKEQIGTFQNKTDEQYEQVTTHLDSLENMVSNLLNTVIKYKEPLDYMSENVVLLNEKINTLDSNVNNLRLTPDNTTYEDMTKVFEELARKQETPEAVISETVEEPVKDIVQNIREVEEVPVKKGFFTRLFGR